MFNPIGKDQASTAGRVVQRTVAENELRLAGRGSQGSYRMPGDPPDHRGGVGPFNRVGPNYKPRNRRRSRGIWLDGF